MRGRFAQSSATVPPAGATTREDYKEIGLDLDARVGILSFLMAQLSVPAVQHLNLRTGTLAVTRVGDPLIGLYAGGGLQLPHSARLELFPFGELSFPGGQAQTLSLANTALLLPDHGVVVDTGGVSVLVGAVAAYRQEWRKLVLEASVRGGYRVRVNASDGIGFDGRARLILNQFWLVGAQLSGLFPMGGDHTAFISASRVGDAAAWLDVGLLLGVRPYPWLDTQLMLTAPLYAHGTSELLQVSLQVLFHWVSPL